MSQGIPLLQAGEDVNAWKRISDCQNLLEYQLRRKTMNRVVAAKEGLSVLIGLDDRVQEALKNAINKPRKPIAGYRFYDCEECGHSGKQKTRDCHSPSHELCEKCNSEASITGSEEHPEWPVDKSGNLV